jgi:hypothetical protein
MCRTGILALLSGLALTSAVPAVADEIAGHELRFLKGPVEPRPHHHSKHLVIRPDSLKSGWVIDRQCHANLDPVPAMQVVFGAGRVRKLRITHHENIGAARVEGDTVQLEQVGAKAVLCLESENRALEYDPVLNQYALVSGPYMRRFLDGYFPMQVSFNLEYPPQQLRLAGIQPVELREGAKTPPGRIQIDTLFEGELRITVRFVPAAPP